MIQVSLCFFLAFDGIVLGRGTAPQSVDLRKDEPHPMAFFSAAPEFLQRLFVYSFLRYHKSIQIKRIFARCLIGSIVHNLFWFLRGLPAPSSWYPHPELNRDQRFRKPPLYPFELWGRKGRQKSYPASVTWSTPAPSSYPIGIGSAMMFFLTPRRKGSAVAMSRIIMGLTGLPDPETSGLHD